MAVPAGTAALRRPRDLRCPLVPDTDSRRESAHHLQPDPRGWNAILGLTGSRVVFGGCAHRDHGNRGNGSTTAVCLYRGRRHLAVPAGHYASESGPARRTYSRLESESVHGRAHYDRRDLHVNVSADLSSLCDRPFRLRERVTDVGGLCSPAPGWRVCFHIPNAPRDWPQPTACRLRKCMLRLVRVLSDRRAFATDFSTSRGLGTTAHDVREPLCKKIGRASCRERV